MKPFHSFSDHRHPDSNKITKKTPAVRQAGTSHDDGRRRARLRVKEKRRRDAKSWSIDGRRRSGTSYHLGLAQHMPSMLTNVHSSPWNERFMFNDSVYPGLTVVASKKRMTEATSTTTLPRQVLNQMKIDSSMPSRKR